MKSQDLTYLFSALNRENKKIEKLQASLQFFTAKNSKNEEPEEEDFDEEDGEEKEQKIKAKHTVFVDNEEEVEKFSAVEYFNTTEELVDRKFNRLARPQLEQDSVLVAGEEILESADSKSLRSPFNQVQREHRRLTRELQQRIDRAAKIQTFIDEKNYEKNVLVGFFNFIYFIWQNLISFAKISASRQRERNTESMMVVKIPGLFINGNLSDRSNIIVCLSLMK